MDKRRGKEKITYTDVHRSDDKYVKFAVDLIKSSAHPLSINMSWGEKGHSLLAYAWEKEDWTKPDENGWYKIYVYDCNYPYPNSDMLNSKYSPAEYYTTSLNYIEMNPDINLWRYEKSATKSGLNSKLIGCDNDNNPIIRSVSGTSEGKKCKYNGRALRQAQRITHLWFIPTTEAEKFICSDCRA